MRRALPAVCLVLGLLALLPSRSKALDPHPELRDPALVAIEAAQRAGTLSEDEAVLLSVQRVFAPDTLPEPYRAAASRPMRCATEVVRTAREAKLSPTDRARVDAWLSPSVELARRTVYVTAEGHFELDFVTTGSNAVPLEDVDPANGIPDFVERVGSYFEKSWYSEFVALGFAAPDLSGGPYQVFLRRIGAYGYTEPTDVGTAGTSITVHHNFIDFPSNDDPEGDQWGAAKVTAAHELKTREPVREQRLDRDGSVDRSRRDLGRGPRVRRSERLLQLHRLPQPDLRSDPAARRRGQCRLRRSDLAALDQRVLRRGVDPRVLGPARRAPPGTRTGQLRLDHRPARRSPRRELGRLRELELRDGHPVDPRLRLRGGERLSDRSDHRGRDDTPGIVLGHRGAARGTLPPRDRLHRRRARRRRGHPADPRHVAAPRPCGHQAAQRQPHRRGSPVRERTAHRAGHTGGHDRRDHADHRTRGPRPGRRRLPARRDPGEPTPESGRTLLERCRALPRRRRRHLDPLDRHRERRSAGFAAPVRSHRRSRLGRRRRAEHQRLRRHGRSRRLHSLEPYDVEGRGHQPQRRLRMARENCNRLSAGRDRRLGRDFVAPADRRLVPDVSGDDGAVVTWRDPDGAWGNVRNGETATAEVLVDFAPDLRGDLVVPYTITGDGFGSGTSVVESALLLAGPKEQVVEIMPTSKVLRAGTTANVAWTATFTEEVAIDLSRDGGTTWDVLTSGTANDGSFDWTVTGPTSFHAMYRVRNATDATEFATSASPFVIAETIGWASVAHAATPLDAGAAGTIEVGFDATSLAEGSYEATLALVVDGLPDPILLPVLLDVSEGGTSTQVPTARAVLRGVRPNPFNPSTNVEFTLNEPMRVRIDVYDAAGRHVRRVFDGRLDTGDHGLPWSGVDAQGTRVGSGVYLVAVDFEGERTIRKISLVE